MWRSGIREPPCPSRGALASSQPKCFPHPGRPLVFAITDSGRRAVLGALSMKWWIIVRCLVASLSVSTFVVLGILYYRCV
jgi:hypothetical protein